MTGVIVVFTILIVLALLSIFVPLVRGVREPLMFFTSGGGNRKDKELIKKSAAASIRDLVIERESGKISAEEFASLAEPLARQIESAEQTREAGARAAAKRVTRLGTFCPGCGSLGKGSICIQCGGAL